MCKLFYSLCYLQLGKKKKTAVLLPHLSCDVVYGGVHWMLEPSFQNHYSSNKFCCENKSWALISRAGVCADDGLLFTSDPWPGAPEGPRGEVAPPSDGTTSALPGHAALAQPRAPLAGSSVFFLEFSLATSPLQGRR